MNLFFESSITKFDATFYFNFMIKWISIGILKIQMHYTVMVKILWYKKNSSSFKIISMIVIMLLKVKR